SRRAMARMRGETARIVPAAGRRCRGPENVGTPARTAVPYTHAHAHGLRAPYAGATRACPGPIRSLRAPTAASRSDPGRTRTARGRGSPHQDPTRRAEAAR